MINFITLDSLEKTKHLLQALIESNASKSEIEDYGAQIVAIDQVINEFTRPSTDYEQSMSGRKRALKSTTLMHE